MDFGRALAAGATMGQSELWGQVGGFFNGGSKDLYSRELINRRRSEIDNFAGQLSQARSKYLNSLQSMYNNAYARFSGNAEAGFANRGLAVNGGAFASALARETSRYQSELEPLAFQAEREDLNTVESLRQNLFGSEFGADVGERTARYQNNAENMRAIGGFGTRLGLAALTSGGSEVISGGSELGLGDRLLGSRRRGDLGITGSRTYGHGGG
jgi:hypothetical protein